MNFREGTRRIGIVLAVLGACVGCVLPWGDTAPVWRTWGEHKRFQALLSTPTVRRASGADWFAKHAPGADKWCDVDPSVRPPPPGYRIIDPCYETNASEKGKLHWIEIPPWEQVRSKHPPVPGRVAATVLRLESFAPDPSRDGIALIHYDSSGAIASLELTTGVRIDRADAPSFLRALVIPQMFPLVGFLRPWGTLKTIAWVVAGFTKSKDV